MKPAAQLSLLPAVVCVLWIAGLQGCSDQAGQAPPERLRGTLPNIVPYLDILPSTVDGQGTAVLRPAEAIPIGSVSDFEIAFTVGEAGIVPGGFVILQVSPWWGWSDPQTQSPQMPGYVEVTTSFSESDLEVASLPLSRVIAFSRERALRAGDTITFHYKNARVDRFAEGEELFQIFVDADGDGHSACIASPPSLRTLARPAQGLVVNAPSQVQPGQQIAIQVAPVDGLGNWSRLPGGVYTLLAARDGKDSGEATIEAATGERTLAFSFTPAEEGIYFFDIEGPRGLSGRSNAALCQAGTRSLNLYFGDIHGHSRLSDGSGTPEDYYRYAREVSGLDLAALTDHADFGTVPIRGAAWERIRKAASEAYEPGRFVTFLGFEWTSWEYGHRNVYYRDGEGPVFRAIDPESDTPRKLWRLLEPHKAMTVAHHIGGGPVATDWDIPPGTKEWLVEMSSIHGTSERYAGEACIYRPVPGAFAQDAMARGYRLGWIGSGDTHDGHPGQRSVGAPVTGLLGVYSPQLTREAIWEALRRRQVYTTSGPKIILNFRVADSPMGSEVVWPASRGGLPIALRVVACDTIKTVEIVRNGEAVCTQPGQGVLAQLLVEDPRPPRGASWYYTRVLQEDGNLAWSSPVWVNVE